MKKYWLGTAKLQSNPLPVEFFRGPKKSDGTKAAKEFMALHAPEGEYDSVQLSPYTGEGRDWKTFSVRWIYGRKGWRKGEGIR